MIVHSAVLHERGGLGNNMESKLMLLALSWPSQGFIQFLMQLIPCLLFHSFGNNGMVATADAGGFSGGLFNHKYLQGNKGSNGV